MEPKQRFSLGYFLVAFILLLVLENYLLSPQVQNLNYSEFKSLLKAGKIEEIVISENYITGRIRVDGIEKILPPNKVENLKRGEHRFKTVKIDDADLVPEMEKAGASFSGTVENPWLKNILSIILPALVFVGIWGFFMKRMGAGGGLISLGKSKAKVYMEKETGITFDDVAGIDEAKAELEEVVAFHEAGHAMVAHLLPGADPVSKISIIPRGIAALGYTQQLPTEDRYLMLKSELFTRLCVLLGGRVAEEITFEDISTGAQNDLQRATDIARRMVVNYGMSEELGLTAYELDSNGLLYRNPLGRTKEYSEETAQAIDREVKKILEEAHDKVRNLLCEQHERLKAAAGQLLEKEVISGEEFRKLMASIEANK